MSNFVRKDFYVAPPDAGAPAQEWQEWLKRDNRMAAADKRAHTRSLSISIDDMPDASAAVMKKNGRWMQVVAIGFAGDFDSGNGSLEPIEEATQDHMITAPWVQSTRGSKSRARNQRRAAARKARRK